jgi:hypothetical protein
VIVVEHVVEVEHMIDRYPNDQFGQQLAAAQKGGSSLTSLTSPFESATLEV